jgi:hypothetical protein
MHAVCTQNQFKPQQKVQKNTHAGVGPQACASAQVRCRRPNVLVHVNS